METSPMVCLILLVMGEIKMLYIDDADDYQIQLNGTGLRTMEESFYLKMSML